jgi:hypothetical protein
MHLASVSEMKSTILTSVAQAQITKDQRLQGTGSCINASS